MISTPFFSIAIPFYYRDENSINQLYRCISSINNQTFKSYEVIISTQNIFNRLKNDPFFINKKINIINAEKITLSGNKWTDKSYIRHTGYPGGQRSLTATELYGKDPARVVEKSVKGMLPKNKLGAALFRNLTVVVGSEHAHAAQKPKAINLEEFK